MPATARGQTNLPVGERLVLWEFAYEIAKKHMASAGAISAISLSLCTYLTSARPLRDILAAGAVAATTSAVYTIVFLLPLNNDLIATRKANELKPMGPKEQERVLEKLDQWRALHRVRIVIGVVPWLASVTALLASEPIIKL
ncbi:hypothetical protein MSAN_01286600 [Mycena sanguinolenta]|uniref:DUF1772-domain-containing protein n=1 Tax=Mycena sanguinolenta TaxID=230812 RepID=A0A8H7D2U0_9AGAR|nr:hypothetical protein MSAN_01286600 [Mycena sanguinolenta]